MPDDLTFSNKQPSSQASRQAWALERHGHLLAEALRKDTSAEARAVEKLPAEQIPAHIVSLILGKADPTQNKGMTAWLVGQYAEGNLRLEDLGTANETLEMFQRYAQRLETTQRDLGKYQSLSAVWEAVIGFAQAKEQHLSGKAQKALERDKAYAESRIIRQDPDGFTIAVPLTEFAAKWWGKGTRWCTAAEKDNRFWQHHEDAPLIVVVIPELKEKGKFQLWVTKRSVQFMDAADEPVSEVLVTEYWPRFALVISFALQQNGGALQYVPWYLRTEDMYRIALAQNGQASKYVPQTLCTVEMCRIAVAQNGMALEHVPKKLRTDELCRIAVAQNGWALQYVYEKLRTDEICCIAVAQNGWALQHVPKKFRTDELCRIAVAQTGGALKHVPEDLRTDEIYRIALAQNGWALMHVPEDLRTHEMCSIAVAQDGLASKYVPEKLRSDEICRIAVAQYGGSLEYVPKKLRTEELFEFVVARHGTALYYVPEKLRTDEMCRIAVAQNGRALQYVPEDLRTDGMCRIAVAQDGLTLMHVPEDLRTEEMCRTAVAQDLVALDYVPAHLRDRMNCSTPSPMPVWDISLLDQLVSLLDTASPSTPLRPPHA